MHRLIAIVVTALACAHAVTATAQPGAPSYEAVVDAGSSGTRLYLYQIQPGQNGPSVSLLLEDEPDDLRGLSNYVDKPDLAGEGEIGPLLAGLERFVQEKGISQKNVTVSVLATAGMRLVDMAAASQIYDSVRQAVVKRGFSARQIGTIAGQDEGIYAWVDLNYLKGNLRAGQDTEGIVEVGGASAQVALAVPSARGLGDGVRRVRIGDLEYAVLSRSFLGLGQNEARRSMVNTVIAEGLAQNPCYPNSTLPNFYFNAVKSRRGQASLQVSGQDANFSVSCFDVYAAVVQQVSASSVNQFPLVQFQSVPGFDTSRFVLMASFYYKLRDWDLLSEQRPDRALLAEVFRRCVGVNAWQTVSALQGGGSFAQNACANATYLYTLIFSGRGLALSSLRVQVLDAVNDQPLTWTRGFAILAAGS
jgi:hypothetical protein